MEKNNRSSGRYIPLALITIMCLAVLWQCSGNHDHDAEKNTDEMVDDANDQMEDTQDQMDDAMNGAEQNEENAKVNDDMEHTASDGDLNFDEGSWAWSIQHYLTSGSGENSFTLDKVPYEGDEISAEGKEQLDNLAALLKAYPDMNVLVKGHSRIGDNAIEKTTNKASSKARALWVQAKLSNRGVSGSQMKAKGIGGDELLADVDGKDMLQRRITIEFEK